LHETSPASQIDSHGLVLAADLQEIIKAWASLADPLKAAILAIVRADITHPSKNFSGTPPPVSGETIHPAEKKEG